MQETDRLIFGNSANRRLTSVVLPVPEGAETTKKRPLPAAQRSLRLVKEASRPLFFLVVAAFLGCCQNGNNDTVTITNSSGEVLTVQVEIADTPEERAQGLMFRESVPEGTGMLFVFSEEVQSPFWMKDTPTSLDMLFIREGQIVSIIENAVPYSEDLLTPGSTYTMVLEVPAGYAANHDIQAGNAVSVP